VLNAFWRSTVAASDTSFSPDPVAVIYLGIRSAGQVRGGWQVKLL